MIAGTDAEDMMCELKYLGSCSLVTGEGFFRCVAPCSRLPYVASLSDVVSGQQWLPFRPRG